MKSKVADEVLLRKVGNKDRVAFENLMVRYDNKMRGTLRRIVRNDIDVEDSLQDAMICVWKYAKGFKGKARASTWIYRVTFNAGLMFLRNAKRHPETEPVEDFEIACGPEHEINLMRVQALEEVQDTLRALPDSMGKDLIRHYGHDVTSKRIAEEKGKTVPAIKSYLNRSKERFLKEYNGYQWKRAVNQ